MTDLPPKPDRNAESVENNGATPRWVKIFGIIALVVLLLFVIMFLTRGRHGPGRHMRGNGSQSSSIINERTLQQS